jgi:hypothetical protein
MEDPGVLLSEGRRMKLIIGDSLSLFLRIGGSSLPIESVRMSKHHVKPERRLYLLHHMREIYC